MSDTNRTPKVIEIPLTQGYVAFIDEIDSDLANLKWGVTADKTKKKYAVRLSSRSTGQKTIRMHRLILERMIGRALEKYEVTDHIDSNPMNNTRSNLRIATYRQNGQNAKVRRDSETKMKGVQIHQCGRYYASIKANGERKHLGYYDSLEDAGIAYNHAAKEFFGEYAQFNDIPNWRNRLPVRRALYASYTNPYRGVSYEKGRNKWAAYIYINKKRLHLGRYDTPELAYAAYLEAKEKYRTA